MTTRSVLEIINHYNLKPSKNLGQNFLINFDFNQIALSAGDLEGKIVIEIGPGPGGLTSALLETKAKKVIAIEADQRCIDAIDDLNQRYGERLEVINTDALKYDYYTLYQEYGEQKLYIIANLPYNIGTKLALKWLKMSGIFASITIMLQKEVVEKLTAHPNESEYGRLAVMTHMLCDAEVLFDVSSDHFFPAPKVTSTVVKLTPLYKPRYACDIEVLEKVCNTVFSQRRKMILKPLKSLISDAETLLEKLNIPKTARPEELTIEQFANIAKAL